MSEEADPLGGMIRNWNFVRSRATPTVRAVRIVRRLRRRCALPANLVIKPASPATRWTCYFVYLPDGQLHAAHRFTLGRLSAEPGKLLVVCATPDPALVPGELGRFADALIWKDMPGFDFSAYSIALHHIAHASAAADVMVMNDSVFGPFSPLGELVGKAPWDLTGFTASSNVENHVQSYAFQIRQLTRSRLRSMRLVFPKRMAFNRYEDVVLGQETQLARVAARTMRVGSLWFADASQTSDPSLYKAVDLVEEGMPFLKRSLLGRLAHYNDPERVRETLLAKGHPVE